MTKNIEFDFDFTPESSCVLWRHYQSNSCVSEGKRNEHNGITPVLVLK